MLHATKQAQPVAATSASAKPAKQSYDSPVVTSFDRHLSALATFFKKGTVPMLEKCWLQEATFSLAPDNIAMPQLTATGADQKATNTTGALTPGCSTHLDAYDQPGPNAGVSSNSVPDSFDKRTQAIQGQQQQEQKSLQQGSASIQQDSVEQPRLVGQQSILPGVLRVPQERKYQAADQQPGECQNHVSTQPGQPQPSLESHSSAGLHLPCAIKSEQPMTDHLPRSHLQVMTSASCSTTPLSSHNFCECAQPTQYAQQRVFLQTQVRLYRLATWQCAAVLRLGAVGLCLQSSASNSLSLTAW